MNFFRQLGLGLSTIIFSAAIFLFAAFVSIYCVFDSPKPLESALQQSGVYDVTIQNVLAQAQKNSGNNTDSIPLDNADVQSAVQAAIPPSTVQSTAKQAINSVYSWMHGTAKTPTFSIDLTQQKNDIASNLGTTLQQKLNGLPVCTAGTPPPQNTSDIFSMTCRPAGVSVNSLVAQVEQQVQGNSIIKNSSLTASNVKDSNGRQLTDKLSYIPKLHRYFILSLFVLPVVILLTATAILFASQTRRRGLRHISTTLLTTGIYSTAIALLSIWLFDRLSTTIVSHSSAQQELTSKLLKVGNVLLTDLRKWWLVFGIGYLLLGIIGLVVVRLTRPKQLEAGKSDKSTGEPRTNSLGHNTNIPQAGTTFTPKSAEQAHGNASAEPPKPKVKDTEPKTNSEPDGPNNKPS